MNTVVLQPVADLMPQVERVLDRAFAQLRSLLPDAELHHIGATALPSGMTKGDVDTLIQVSPAQFSSTVEVLQQCFAVKQPDNWTTQFASFGDDTGHELPLGIQVVVKDSSDDFLLYLRDYFIAHPEALEHYNRLKINHACDGSEGYWRAKDEFLRGILDARENGDAVTRNDATSRSNAIAEELKKLQGTWRQVAWEKDGKSNPPEEQGWEPWQTIAGNSFLVTLADGSTVIKGTFKLDPTQQPKTIDWTDTFGADAGKTFPAIYSLENDCLIFCAADDGCGRPTEFTAKLGQVMRVSRRATL